MRGKSYIEKAVEQSQNDAENVEMFALFHCKNRQEWLVTMPIDDWMKLYDTFKKSKAGLLFCSFSAL